MAAASAAARLIGGVHLAPMVRCGTLPLRLLALVHKADLVWSEELIAHRLARTVRVQRRLPSGLVVTEFIERDTGSVMFRTVPAEHSRVMLQMGVPTPELARAAGRLVARDVAGLEVNMGCPKPFSTLGNMGSALLEKPELAAELVAALREVAPPSVLVTAKIRLRADAAATLHLVELLAAAGAAAVSVHLRTAGMRPNDMPLWQRACELVASWPAAVPLILNGDVWSCADARQLVHASQQAERSEPLQHPVGWMLARPALARPHLFLPAAMGQLARLPWASRSSPRPAGASAACGTLVPSVFQTPGTAAPSAKPKHKRVPDEDAPAWMFPASARLYVLLAAAVGEHPSNTKYTLNSFMRDRGEVASPAGQALTRAKSLKQLAQALADIPTGSVAAAGRGWEWDTTVLEAVRLPAWSAVDVASMTADAYVQAVLAAADNAGVDATVVPDKAYNAAVAAAAAAHADTACRPPAEDASPARAGEKRRANSDMELPESGIKRAFPLPAARHCESIYAAWGEQ